MVIYTFKKCTLTEKMSLSDMACQSHKNNIKSENKAIVRPCHCLDLYANTANFCLQNIKILSCRAYKHSILYIWSLSSRKTIENISGDLPCHCSINSGNCRLLGHF